MRYILIVTTILLPTILTGFMWDDNGIAIRQGVHIEWFRTGGDVGDDGEVILAWSDTRNGIRDIFAQKIDSNGNALWSDGGIEVVTEPGRQEDPILISDDNGGAYIIWADYKDEPSYGDIYIQHIDSDGIRTFADSGIGLATNDYLQSAPNACKDGSGGVYVIWNNKETTTFGEIYGTHVSSNGTVVDEGLGTPLISYSFTTEFSNPSLEYAGNGEAIMVWEDPRNNNIDIYAQKIQYSDGVLETIWTSAEEGGIPICDNEEDQTGPKVTTVNDTYTAVVWEDKRDNWNPDIYGQLIEYQQDGSFSVVYEDDGRVIATDSRQQINPRVKASDGGTFVVWEDYRLGNQPDIYIQKIDESGTDLWGENGIAVYEEPDFVSRIQSGIRLTIDGQGGVYVIWEDNRDDLLKDIYVQHIASDGSLSFESTSSADIITVETVSTSLSSSAASLAPAGPGYTIEYQVSIRAFKASLSVAEFPTVEGNRIADREGSPSVATGLAFLKLFFRELFTPTP